MVHTKYLLLLSVSWTQTTALELCTYKEKTQVCILYTCYCYCLYLGPKQQLWSSVPTKKKHRSVYYTLVIATVCILDPNNSSGALYLQRKNTGLYIIHLLLLLSVSWTQTTALELCTYKEKTQVCILYTCYCYCLYLGPKQQLWSSVPTKKKHRSVYYTLVIATVCILDPNNSSGALYLQRKNTGLYIIHLLLLLSVSWTQTAALELCTYKEKTQVCILYTCYCYCLYLGPKQQLWSSVPTKKKHRSVYYTLVIATVCILDPNSSSGALYLQRKNTGLYIIHLLLLLSVSWTQTAALELCTYKEKTQVCILYTCYCYCLYLGPKQQLWSSVPTKKKHRSVYYTLVIATVCILDPNSSSGALYLQRKNTGLYIIHLLLLLSVSWTQTAALELCTYKEKTQVCILYTCFFTVFHSV